MRGMANSSGTTHIVGPLAEAQARLGGDVSVLCVEKGRQPPVLPDSTLVRSRCLKLSVPLDNPGISLDLARTLNRDVNSFDVVHIHAVWNFPTFWAMRSAYRAGVPYVVAPQGSFDPWALAQNRWGKRLYGSLTEVPLIRHASCVQALTEKEAAQFRDFGLSTRIEVIANGVDEYILRRDRSPDPEHFGLPAGCAVLLYMSRIHAKKGLDLLVAAAEILRRDVPALRIVIAGDDAGSGYLSAIKTECTKRNLEDVLLFVGELRGEAKLEALAAADAFILPSRSEGLPVAALEALSAGLPVILTDECNLAEVDGCGAGYVVPPDSRRIAGAVRELFLLDRAERREMGDRGRALVAANFTWPGIAARTMELYQGLSRKEVVH